MPPSSTKTSSSKDKRSPDGFTKTLTPQRKHRKLLKDGTSEVWPEILEEIFVEGLRQYWKSPYATYSRGRSRWRNQFLVDYLQKAGIERSKKQVASHIQVLRNMWKGEPEFHLVAGGEELFLETGLLAPVKAEDQIDTSTLLTLDTDDTDAHSPVSPSTPSLSPVSVNIYNGRTDIVPLPMCPASPALHSPLYSSGPFPSSPGNTGIPLTMFATKTCHDGGIAVDNSPFLSSSPSEKYSFEHRVPRQGTISPQSIDSNHYHQSEIPSPSSTSSNYGRGINQPAPTFTPLHIFNNGPSSSFTSGVSPPISRNRICFISLWADGMQPFVVPAATTSPIALQPTTTLRLKLRLSSIDDIRSPQTLHGFHATVTLAAPWSSVAECITKVFANGICISQESGSLQLLSSSTTIAENLMVQAFLPESPLSRSRWLDPTIQTSITQHIVVDNVLLAVVTYDLDRKDNMGNPSVELIDIQRRSPHDQNIPSQLLSPVLPISLSYRSSSLYNQGYPIIPPLSRGNEPTSLSCALTPVNTNLWAQPVMNASLLY